MSMRLFTLASLNSIQSSIHTDDKFCEKIGVEDVTFMNSVTLNQGEGQYDYNIVSKCRI